MTDSNISWELMHVYLDDQSDSMNESGEYPIGALASIVRWMPELRFYDIDIELNIKHEKLNGKILAYLDKNLKHLEKEEQILKKFNTKFCNSHLNFGDELICKEHNNALGYIASHGIIVKDPLQKEMLVSSLEMNEGFSYRHWENLDFIPMEKNRPIIFANTCFSAWIFRDKMKKRYGLPVTLLSRIAKGFLGTLGPVGDAKDFAAPDIGKWILDELYQNGCKEPLSNILLKLRRKVLKELKSNKNPNNWKLFLYMFEYVYYGNPLLLINLKNK